MIHLFPLIKAFPLSYPKNTMLHFLPFSQKSAFSPCMGNKKKFAKIKKLLHSKKEKELGPPEETHNDQPQADEYFKINHNLIPPYSIIMDTNFVNHSIKRKIDITVELKRCLATNYNIYVTDCVIAELEKLGRVFRVALGIVKRFKRLTCDHKGTYADDCIISRVTVHRCYLVATCDTELKQRIRKIPGVPIIYVKGYSYEVEKLPKAVITTL